MSVHTDNSFKPLVGSISFNFQKERKRCVPSILHEVLENCLWQTECDFLLKSLLMFCWWDMFHLPMCGIACFSSNIRHCKTPASLGSYFKVIRYINTKVLLAYLWLQFNDTVSFIRWISEFTNLPLKLKRFLFFSI